MKNKKIFTLLTLTLIMAFSVGIVGAQENEPKAAMVEKVAPLPLTDKQLMELDTLRKEHRAKMSTLHDQFWGKEMEYEAMLNNPNLKHADIKALIEEMKVLKSQIRNEKNIFFETLASKGLGDSVWNNFDCGRGKHGKWSYDKKGPRGHYGKRNYGSESHFQGRHFQDRM